MDPNHLLKAARQQFLDGEVAAAIQSLERLEELARTDSALLQQIAGTYLQCGQNSKADRCYRRAVEVQPNNPDCIYNLATSRVALGDIEEAEGLFTRAIKLNPQDYGAWLNRSGLKKQTTESNHVEQLQYIRAHLDEEDAGRVQVCFALAKELEDLGRSDESFQYLQEGAHRRRLGMQYDVAEDEQAMAAVSRAFGPDLFQGKPAGHSSNRPVFILGLPRLSLIHI